MEKECQLFKSWKYRGVWCEENGKWGEKGTSQSVCEIMNECIK